MDVLRRAVTAEMIVSRMLIAMSSLTWGILLLIAGDLFEGRQIYTIMAEAANERVWMVLFIVHGLASLTALFMQRVNVAILLLDGVLGCALWSLSTILCFAVYFNVDGAALKLPAAMSPSIWVAIVAWIHLVKQGAEVH